MSEPPVSACLLSWRRPCNLRAIVAALLRAPYIDEILIWNNEASVEIPVAHPKVRVIRSPENLICLGRWECVKQARNEIVYVQDDDAVLENIGELFRAFRADPTRIAHALSPQHFAARSRELHGECHVALVGWGAFLKRDWVSVLDDMPPDLRGWELYRREADKFVSVLLERHHTTVLGRLRQLDGNSTPGVALWRDSHHVAKSALAVREALGLARARRPVVMPVPWHVVVVCSDYGRYLGEAVGSLFGNAADYAITIVDDASSDNTRDMAEEFVARHPRIRYLRNETKRGVAFSRNRGIASLDSTFVVLLDADDRLGAGYLRAAGRVLEQACDVANPDAILFGERSARWPVPATVTLPMLMRHNSVHYCAAFRRSYWAQVGGFDEGIPYWEDYELWLRMAAAGARIRAVPGDHFFYRQHGGSAMSHAREMEGDLRRYMRTKHADLYRRVA